MTASVYIYIYIKEEEFNDDDNETVSKTNFTMENRKNKLVDEMVEFNLMSVDVTPPSMRKLDLSPEKDMKLTKNLKSESLMLDKRRITDLTIGGHSNVENRKLNENGRQRNGLRKRIKTNKLIADEFSLKQDVDIEKNDKSSVSNFNVQIFKKNLKTRCGHQIGSCCEIQPNSNIRNCIRHKGKKNFNFLKQNLIEFYREKADCIKIEFTCGLFNLWI